MPLGFMAMPPPDEVLLLPFEGKEMGMVTPPMVTESGIIDIIDPPPPKFIV